MRSSTLKVDGEHKLRTVGSPWKLARARAQKEHSPGHLGLRPCGRLLKQQLWGGTFVSFSATMLMVVCYSNSRKSASRVSVWLSCVHECMYGGVCVSVCVFCTE